MEKKNNSPFPNFVLALPFPLIRSHILSVLSFPTLNATFPVGCTATLLTLPLWPLSVRSTAQSLVRKRQRVPSSEAERRCEREGKDKCVIEPVDYQNSTKEKTNGEEQRVVVSYLHDASNPQPLSSSSNPILSQSRLRSPSPAIFHP